MFINLLLFLNGGVADFLWKAAMKDIPSSKPILGPIHTPNSRKSGKGKVCSLNLAISFDDTEKITF